RPRRGARARRRGGHPHALRRGKHGASGRERVRGACQEIARRGSACSILSILLILSKCTETGLTFTVLVADRISKHYDTPRGPVPILEDVSLTLDRGESVAIMGPSGCGKSTLLYLFGALEPPSAGSIQIDGRNPYEL